MLRQESYTQSRCREAAVLPKSGMLAKARKHYQELMAIWPACSPRKPCYGTHGPNIEVDKSKNESENHYSKGTSAGKSLGSLMKRSMQKDSQ